MKKELSTYNMTMGFKVDLKGYNKMCRTDFAGEKFEIYYKGEKPLVNLEHEDVGSYTFNINGKNHMYWRKRDIGGIIDVNKDGSIYIHKKSEGKDFGKYVKYCCIDSNRNILLRNDRVDVYLGKSLMRLGSRLHSCDNKRMFDWLKEHDIEYKITDGGENVYLDESNLTEPTDVMIIVNKHISLDKDDFIELSNISSDCMDYMNFICRLFDKKYIDITHAENWANRMEELFDEVDK